MDKKPLDMTENTQEETKKKKPKNRHKKVWITFAIAIVAVLILGLAVPAYENSKTKTIKALIMPQSDENVLVVPDPTQREYTTPVSVPIKAIAAADFDPSDMKSYQLVEAVVKGNDNGAFTKLYTLKSIEDPQLEYLFNLYLAQFMGSN